MKVKDRRKGGMTARRGSLMAGSLGVLYLCWGDSTTS